MNAMEMKREAARRAANSAGLTQVQIAEKMGLTQSYVSKILQGNAPLERIRELVEVCGARLTITIER